MSRLLQPIEKLGELVAGGRAAGRTLLWAGLILIVTTTALVHFAVRNPLSVNPASRLAAIVCIVDHKDWSIDHSGLVRRTPDRVIIQGRFYSSKPPMYAAVGAVVYGAVSNLFIAENAESRVFYIVALRIFNQVFPFLLGLIVAGRFLRSRVNHPEVWLWGVLAFAMGTLLFGYSAVLNNHSVSALLILASFVGAIRLTEKTTDSIWVWFGVGLTAAAAVTLDLGAAVFALGLGAFLLLRAPRAKYIFFILGAVIPTLIYLHLTHELVGGWSPIYGRAELYDYPNSYWNHPREFDALHEPWYVYAFHVLIGHHGLFAMTPLFVFAIPGVWVMWRRRLNGISERALAALIAVVTLVTITVYIGYAPTNYGGKAIGMRWLIVLVPLLWYAALRYVDEAYERKLVQWTFRVFVLVGVVHATLALSMPFRVSPWNHLFRHLGLGSVPPAEW